MNPENVMPQSLLLEEIEKLVLERIQRGLITDTAWMAQAVLDLHQDLQGEDADFYRLCAWNHVRTSIRMVVRDYKLAGAAQADKQLLLPGMTHVQKAYAVEQKDGPKIVPVELMSAEELTKKAEELRQMAEGCLKHADELDRYRVDKFGE